MTIHVLLVFIIIIANGLISYKGFKERSFLEKYKFEVDSILVRKEYFRLVSSGFLHVDWMHLLLNMVTFYSFAELLSVTIGVFPFLLVYFGSLIGGNLFSLFIHKAYGDYSAVGASGAVCGVIFATIAMVPGIETSLFILPIYVPGWLFGLLFVGITLYGIKSKRDNIGHEAHLGGAFLGMIIAIILNPGVISVNYIPILVVTIPTLLFIILIINKPHLLLIESDIFFKTKKKYYSIEHRYNEQKVNQQKEIDEILEKIGKKGINSLTAKEKEKLEEFSK
ncbi:rhomboid family protein [Flavobacterium humi]|uniref:Rhomboid family intramembrane serine protease n=1 Tax=Flavobacterium humi TaxID=2562683 RepID=A0A4Z0L8G8_9FLAO|nr:rhomboid family intramembrane serine protease [Flavobacterium humi]TGD57905.1 rhomboid family intramembrane serine protease [Flavobacterium humi]